jgi:hypothetical protein
MTEGDKNEVKFEIEKFKAKKSTKFVVQVGMLFISFKIKLGNNADQ